MDAVGGCCAQCGGGVVEDLGVGLVDADFAGDEEGVELVGEAGGGDFAALERAVGEVGDQADGAVSAGGGDCLGCAGDGGGALDPLVGVDRGEVGEVGALLVERAVDSFQGAGHPGADVEPAGPLAVVFAQDVGDDLLDGAHECVGRGGCEVAGDEFASDGEAGFADADALADEGAVEVEEDSREAAVLIGCGAHASSSSSSSSSSSW